MSDGTKEFEAAVDQVGWCRRRSGLQGARGYHRRVGGIPSSGGNQVTDGRAFHRRVDFVNVKKMLKTRGVRGVRGIVGYF